MTSALFGWGIMVVYILGIAALVISRNYSGLCILLGVTVGIFAPMFAFRGLTIPGDRLFSMIGSIFGSMFGVMTLVAVAIWQANKIEELRRLVKTSDVPAPHRIPATKPLTAK